MHIMKRDSARIIFIITVLSLLLLIPDIHKAVLAASSGKGEKHKALKIVIDPGHGGKAPGAVSPNGEKEKDITLSVSKALSKRLSEEGFEVSLTREDDIFIPLEERTAFANRINADLFVSIHVNANEKESMEGVETYFLNLTTDASSMKVAERENAMTSESLSGLQLIIKDLMLNAKINESSRFAASIQKSIISTLGKSGYAVKNHGVKQAPFYVLLGAKMPSILIEIGFITNTAECRLLHNKAHQDSIVDGIITGINAYIAHPGYAYNNKDHG